MKRVLFGVLLMSSLMARGVEGNMLGQMTQNEGMVAVPAPAGGVVVDGDLGEWDLSGEIWSFSDYELRNQYSVKTAMMWDRENLYIGCVWKDPMPMNSLIDPDFDANLGWRADSLQCRMQAGAQPLWITCWWFKDRPVVHLAYWTEYANRRGTGTGKLYKGVPGSFVLEDGIESAYRKLPGGDGFVQELKLPWTVLFREHIAEGEEIGNVQKEALAKLAAGDGSVPLTCAVEFRWGAANGTSWPHHIVVDNMAKGETTRNFLWERRHMWGELTLSDRSVPEKRTYEFRVTKPKGSIPVRAKVPREATTFTLVVEDASGKRVRNLAGGFDAGAYRVDADTVEVLWDGLDDAGALVEAGEYRVRGLTHEGLSAEYVMTYYNPGTPPWSVPDGTGGWGSDHARTEDVVRSGTNVVLAADFVEGGYGVWAVGPAGKKVWSEKRGVIKIAANAKYVFNVPNNWYTQEECLYRYHAADGTYAPFVKDGVERPMNLTLREIVGVDALKEYPVAQRVSVGDYHNTMLGKAPKVLGLMAGPETVVVALCEGLLVEVDQETGDKVAEYKLDFDTMLMEKAGNVNGTWTDRVFAPMAFDGERFVFFRDGVLTEYDKRTGESRAMAPKGIVGRPIAMALDGAGNVVVADVGPDCQVKKFSREGALLRTYGKKGGRARAGVFDEGAMREMSGVAVDASGKVWVVEFTDFPRRVSVWNEDGSFCRDYLGTTGYMGSGCFLHDEDVGRAFAGPNEFALNEEDYSSKMVQVLWNPEPGLPTFSIPMGSHNGGHIFRSKASGQEREYFFQNGLLYMNDGGRWTLVSGFFAVGDIQKLWVGGDLRVVGALPHGDFEGMNPYDYLLWNDGNGDGLVQRSECEVVPSKARYPIGDRYSGLRAECWTTGWGQRMDPEDLSFYMTAKHKGATGEDWLFRPAEFAPNGAPRYTLAAVEKVLGYPDPGHHDLIPVKGEDRVLTFTKVDKHDVVAAIGKKGHELQWTYPNPYHSVPGSHRAEMPRPGLLVGPLKIAGVVEACGDASGVFMLRGNLGTDFYMTTDGLYVDQLFRDGRLPSPPNPKDEETLRGMPFHAFNGGGEPFNGWIGRHRDGKVRMVNGFSWQGANVAYIRGLEKIRYFVAESIVVDDGMRVRAEADNLSRAVVKGAVKPYTIGRREEKPSDWSAVPAMALEKEGLPAKGKCRMVYTAEALCVRFEVEEESPWKNGGRDKTRLFKTGDCVDVCLSPTGNAGEAGEGDLRVVTSPFGAGSVSMLMRKVYAGAKAEEAVKYQSPVWDFVMAQVKELGAPKVTVHEGGYVVELELAWSELGVEPVSGKKLRGDAGMILSDAAGTINVARVYYANKQTNLVNDLPSEASLYPKHWVEWVLE